MDQTRGVIFIAEHHSIQNDLLVCYLDENAGLKCVSIDGLEKFLVAEKTCSDHQLLVILDCLGLENSEIYESIQTILQGELNRPQLALMNLNPAASVEKIALEFGVRGFFYEHDSVTCLVKGVNAILSGEVWISRQKMFECFSSERKAMPTTTSKPSILSRREREILRHLSRGGSNESIATALCISPHTVRTHIYNIFKKIDVPNRLQASLWAAKYL